ncbi:MAG: hypothetical protein NTY73_02350 [Candidatus Micrarchaeota archaeon]|nr:hypothetical protein [Candidatus Micrarchaeota archaeon]
MKLHFFNVKTGAYETKENKELCMEELCKKCKGPGGDAKKFIKSYYTQHGYQVVDNPTYARINNMGYILRCQFLRNFGVSKKQFMADLDSKGRPDFLVYNDKENFFVVASSLRMVSAYTLKWVFSKSYPSKIVIQDTQSVIKEKILFHPRFQINRILRPR